ncbi:hypothetical protein AWZ03_003363 [Drosophila navojoa]|uniref:Uncharacterized protein n=1 Tax=Drosophila navojoa TaxID=7232 RepID=A0A484BMX8_DRONA|nr:hypothetical protein AWZ03_003363 [Drosophila navojoa]
MNNSEHSDERFNNLPVNEQPNPYQNHNLNASVWLLPLERGARASRELAHSQLMAESERVHELLQLARRQVQHSGPSRATD